ncbi:tripartite tricarboxylate transporter substrate binding protein [Pantoea sp. 18069]|uniref:Bug family tripartite tricarboxylate transporter substrate binding protein n=1 Tax=Pantoea sp. 18069 TaxID=2681415 RepID=UPI0013567E0B|nr:tripartite tricarboxylate transporter substrate binding protein [Pantoea sp. 18069]
MTTSFTSRYRSRHLDRRDVLRAASALVALPWVNAIAQSGSTARMIVPFTPGASNDTIGRLVADALGRRSGRTWIVENKPGAGSQLGTDLVAKAQPDGNTLLLSASAGMVILPAIKPSMPYAVNRDFTYLARIATSPFALVVNAQLPVRSLEEFVHLAKTKPGSVRIGTSGVGSLDYMGAALLQTTTGIELNIIPYKGMSQVLNDLRAGHIDASIVSPATVAPLVAERKVRALAVLDTRQSASLPGVPSARDAGHPRLQVVNWWGIAGPARLPAAVNTALTSQIETVLADPAFRKSLEDKGFEVAPLKGREFAQFVAADLLHWRTVAAQARISMTD